MALPMPPRLGTRLAASAVLIPAALGAVYLGGWILAVFASAAGYAMSREWIRIVHRESGFGWRLILHCLAIGGSQVVLLLGYPQAAGALVLGLAIIGSALAQRAGERGVWTVAGMLFVALPCLAFAELRSMIPYGLETAIWLLCVVWATDSAAYLAGSAIGGPKLVPFISPNKTWTGAIAGLMAGVGASLALVALGGLEPRAPFILCSLFLSLLTQCGDLAESFLKRTFGVKDASDLIPGHGGALDRLDGMIFATLGLWLTVHTLGTSPIAWTVS